MPQGLLDHRLRWRYLAERRKNIDFTGLAIAVVALFYWLFGGITPAFSEPSGDIWVYVAIGLCEVLNCCPPGYRAWTNSVARSPIVRLWAVLRSLTLLLRLATLVPVVVIIWCFAQTLSPEGFPTSWREFGLAPRDLGWVPFFYLILPAYLSRFDVLGADPASGKETRHRSRQARIRPVWYGAAFVGALIGLNILLNRLGYSTFWRETNQSCISIIFLPICWDIVKKAFTAREDNSDDA